MLRVCENVSKAQISALEPFTVSLVCPRMTMIMSLTAQTADPVQQQVLHTTLVKISRHALFTTLVHKSSSSLQCAHLDEVCLYE